MPRPVDEFVSAHANKTEGGWNCNYCGRSLKGSASRMRAHLSGKGEGASACKKVPGEIREEAVRRTPQKRILEPEEDHIPAGQIMSNAIGVVNRNNNPVLQDPLSSFFNGASAYYNNGAGGFATADHREDALTVGVSVGHLLNELPTSPSVNHYGEESVAQGRGQDIGVQAVGSTGHGEEGSNQRQDIDLLQKRALEEYVTDAFVKFFLCQKATLFASDFMDDPNFKEFLKRVRQYGFPSRLLEGDSHIVDRSLFGIKHVVNQYMSEVMKSWKITGCTLIGFNPKDMKVKSSDVSKDKFAVLGFYSPKGFIFFEGPNITRYPDCNYLKIHLPTLDIDHVTIYVMTHLCEWGCEGCLSSCEFSDMNICDWINNLDYEKSTCVCHDMQDICIDVCKKSEWAQRLIKKGEEIHCFFFNSSLHLRIDYYKALKGKGFKGFANGKHARSLSCFLAIMMFEKDELESLGRYLGDMTFLDDSNFWSDGKILKCVLILLLEKIPHSMDTLIPSTSYVWETISYVERWKLDDLDDGFREALKSKLRGTYAYLYTAACLNPRYFNEVGEDERLKLIKAMKEDWIYDDFLFAMEEEPNNEVERYNSKISNSDAYFCNFSHPVKWWQEKGGDYPILQEYAIKVLSKPVSCMCNQVKKHFAQLEGADDYILRLNVRMMEEYKSFGDNTYKPIYLHRSFYG